MPLVRRTAQPTNIHCPGRLRRTTGPACPGLAFAVHYAPAVANRRRDAPQARCARGSDTRSALRPPPAWATATGGGLEVGKDTEGVLGRRLRVVVVLPLLCVLDIGGDTRRLGGRELLPEGLTSRKTRVVILPLLCVRLLDIGGDTRRLGRGKLLPEGLGFTPRKP